MGGRAPFAIGVDAGSGWTRAAICLLERERLRLLGVGEVRSQPQGWIKGKISDQAAVARSIAEAVEQAERCAQIAEGSAQSIVLGMGGPTVRGANARGSYDSAFPREITAEDVNRAIKRASNVQLPEDRLLLSIAPQDFAVDGNPGHRNPAGKNGAHLEAYVHVVTASEQEHQSLVGAANQAHLMVEETVFEPVAAGHAAMRPEDRREGVAIIDIGSHSTEVAVYYGEALCFSASFPVCGDHFTRDVARGLLVTYEEAECIKEQHGCAIMKQTADNSIIEVPSPAGRAARETSRRDLNMILEARAEELFAQIQHDLARIGIAGTLMGVVLCGGGARLQGLYAIAERILGCQARHGLPVGILDWPPYLDHPGWTTVAGLTMYSARLRLRADKDKKGNGFLGGLFR